MKLDINLSYFLWIFFNPNDDSYCDTYENEKNGKVLLLETHDKRVSLHFILLLEEGHHFD